MLSFTVNETLQMRLRTLMWGDYAGLGVGPSVITAAPDKSEREAGVSGVRLGDAGLFKHLIKASRCSTIPFHLSPIFQVFQGRTSNFI